MLVARFAPGMESPADGSYSEYRLLTWAKPLAGVDLTYRFQLSKSASGVPISIARASVAEEWEGRCLA